MATWTTNDIPDQTGKLVVVTGATGGQYFGPQGWNEMKGPQGIGKIEPQARDAAVAAKLWTASETLTGVAFG